ncbi:MAG: hypothetical protein AAFM92_00415 [Pseudomonadota bacterium]
MHRILTMHLTGRPSAHLPRHLSASVSALALAASVASAGGHAMDAADLQAALDAGGTVIVTGPVASDTTLTYSGTDPLTIVGGGNTITMSANADILAITEGADVTITGLALVGPGGFSIENRGDMDGPAGKGLFVRVPEDATGTVSVSLTDVSVAGVANHGIHVSDCSLADACGGGGGGAGEGSAASISLAIAGVTVDAAGTGAFDADGLRVDERGAGSILFTAANSTFTNVGADGIELDEGQEGDVIVTAVGLNAVTNGNYCDPAILNTFLPDPAEGEFEAGAFAEADVPPAVTGSPDDTCIEREVDLHDDGSVEEFAFGLDLDDGFDIDEAGPGSIHAAFILGDITGNLDEGLDFDEEDAGDIRLYVNALSADGNTDDAIKFTEEGPGDGIVEIVASRVTGNGGPGLVFEEADEGDLIASVTDVDAQGNDDGETGVEAVQEDDGAGFLTVRGTVADGFDLEGVELMEN